MTISLVSMSSDLSVTIIRLLFYSPPPPFFFFKCQGVGGIIIVTMVTGFMVVYNSSSGGRSPSSASRSLHSHHKDAPGTKRKQSVQVSTLEGVAGIMDLKVNMHHMCRVKIGLISHNST